MFAHGAHTIRSGTWVKSVSFGSHILFKQVWCVMPFFMQQPRTSALEEKETFYVSVNAETSLGLHHSPGNTGTTAVLGAFVFAPSNVIARILCVA